MAGRDRWWFPAIAWLVVAIVHTLVGVWLARPVTTPRASADDDVALQIEFIQRPEAREQRQRRLVEVLTRTQHGGRQSRRSAAQAPASADGEHPAVAGQRAAESAVIDLRPPEPHAPFQPRDPFERRAPIDARRTRFEQAWVPAGDALQQARFRSKAVGTALGLFGGPPRHCSEIERRLRRPDCLPLHGQDAQDEALRRSVD